MLKERVWCLFIRVYPCPSVADSFLLRNWKLNILHSKFEVSVVISGLFFLAKK